MADIVAGMLVVAECADGKVLTRRAATGVVDGRDFPVVWLCREEDWPLADGEANIGVPWPAYAVRPVA